MLWPLPGHAHIPGRTSTADPRLEEILTRMDSQPDRLVQRGQYGCQLFEAGFYWEAHEAWEPVWHAARPNSAAGLLLQAAIALANAALKIRMHQPRAARRLTSRARSLLAGCPPAAELEKLHPDRLAELADWLEAAGLDSLEKAERKHGQKHDPDKESPADAGTAPQKQARLAELAAGLSLQGK